MTHQYRSPTAVVPESAVDGGGATVEYLSDEDTVVVDNVRVIGSAGDTQPEPRRALYIHHATQQQTDLRN